MPHAGPGSADARHGANGARFSRKAAVTPANSVKTAAVEAGTVIHSGVHRICGQPLAPAARGAAQTSSPLDPMSDPLIDLGQYQVRLSMVRASTSSRRQHLAALHERGTKPKCLCVPHGVEMGVAKRATDPALFYLYHLHRPDPLLHALHCPNRVDPEARSSEAGDGAAAAGEPLGGAIHRVAPSTKVRERPLAFVDAPILEPRRIQPQPVQPAGPIGMSGLLETLFKEAGLNTWRPAFAGHRSYRQVRYRLIEASKRIEPLPGRALSDLLYVPPQWTPTKKEDINFEWETFLELLQPSADGVVPRGVVFGLVRDIEARPEWSSPAIKLADFRDRFWLDDVPELLPQPLESDARWVVLLAVEMHEFRRRPRVVDAAAMRVSANWIPVFSRAHGLLADHLVQAGEAFTAPLASDKATAWAVPDFIVRTSEGSFVHGPSGRRALKPRRHPEAA